MMERLGYQYNRNGEKLLIQTAIGNIAAATTDGALTIEGATLAAVPGKRYYVLAILAHLAGSTATNVTLNSKPSGSAGTAISSTKQVAANGGWAMARGNPQDYLYRTKRGEALTVTTGAGSTVGIDLIVTIDD